MSRIAVVTSHPLFASGGHLVIARALVRALTDAGHEATLLLTPQNRFGRQGAAYLSTWLTDVGQAYDGGSVDQVISLRFPSYAVRHEHHVCWINHRMREYYDRWPQFSGTLSWPSWIKESARRSLVHAADRYFLTDGVTRVVAQSATIQARLAAWGRIAADVVHPPPPPRAYRCDQYGDYMLVASRLTPLKRIDLVLEALRQSAASGVRCVVVGDGESREELVAMADRFGLGQRVTFAGHVPEEALLDHLARCRAVCFPALAEDYGLVTVEAFASHKAVVTCTDSGGPTELVVDGDNGDVVPAEPAALAERLARLMEDPSLAERYGASAAARAREMTWERAVQQLLLV